jgi:hypothetical protein
MNPFKDSIDKRSFIKWSMVFVGLQTVFWLSVGILKAPYQKVWLPLRLSFAALYFILTLLVLCRRVQGSRLNDWFAIFYFVPIAGPVLWIWLFFI